MTKKEEKESIEQLIKKAKTIRNRNNNPQF